MERFQIILRALYCGDTTENGHDEVYFIYGGVDGSGKQISHRGPDATQSADADNNTAWDMNDSGGQQNRPLNCVLYEGDLDTSKTATLQFAFLESDGTDYATTVQAAAAVAAKIGQSLQDPTTIVVADIAGFLGSLIPKNQDDLLGSFAISVENAAGTIRVKSITLGSYTSFMYPLDAKTGHFTVHFNHDSGDYNAHFGLQAIGSSAQSLGTGGSLGSYDGVFNPGTFIESVQYSIGAADVSTVYKTQWEAGKRLSSVQPRETNAGLQFDLVFDSPAHEQKVLWNSSEADFRKHYAEMWDQKMRLITIRPLAVHSAIQFAGVWNPSSNSQVVTYNQDQAGMEKQVKDFAAKGLHPVDLAACQNGDKILYYGIFDALPAPTSYFLAYAPGDLAKLYGEMWKKNSRLTRLQAFTLDGQVRYNGVFQAGSHPQYAVFGDALAEFQSQYQQTMSKGYRLISLCGC